MQVDYWRAEDIDFLKGRRRNCNAVTAEAPASQVQGSSGAGMALQNSDKAATL